MPSEAIWIFGIYERISKKVYFEAVQKRDAQTLYKIISKKVRPNSIIYSDYWAVYSEIRKHFEVKSVNHKLYFVHPDDNSNHINNIERAWRTFKEDMRRACNKNYNIHLREFMFRRMNFTENLRENLVLLLKLIKNN